MIFCSIKVYKYLKCHRHSLSNASRRVQSDLNKILLAQAIVPIFTAFLPMILLILGALVEWDFVFETFICGILFSWIPTGNAISVLLFVTAYRMRLKRLFLRAKSRLPRFFSISITVGTNS